FPSWHLNVQEFVAATRARFESCHRNPDGSEDRRLITHGFHERTHHYVWGWSARVPLRLLRHDLVDEGSRPAFYLRVGRVGDYLYPVPGEPGLWYGGSSRVTQAVPRRLDVRNKWAAWLGRVLPWLDGLAKIQSAFPPRDQG